nr:hypothetical protein TetV2_00575 [Oceanusvirus sp.]
MSVRTILQVKRLLDEGVDVSEEDIVGVLRYITDVTYAHRHGIPVPAWKIKSMAGTPASAAYLMNRGVPVHLPHVCALVDSEEAAEKYAALGSPPPECLICQMPVGVKVYRCGAGCMNLAHRECLKRTRSLRCMLCREAKFALKAKPVTNPRT